MEGRALSRLLLCGGTRVACIFVPDLLQPARLPLQRVEFISAFQISVFQLLFSLWRRLTQAWSSARNVGRAKWRPKKNRQSGSDALLNAFRRASISPKGSRFSISASNRKLR